MDAAALDFTDGTPAEAAEKAADFNQRRWVLQSVGGGWLVRAGGGGCARAHLQLLARLVERVALAAELVHCSGVLLFWCCWGWRGMTACWPAANCCLRCSADILLSELLCSYRK